MLDINRRFSFFLVSHPGITSISEFVKAVLPEKWGTPNGIAKHTQKSQSNDILHCTPGEIRRIRNEDFPKELQVWKQSYLRNDRLKPYHQTYGPPGYEGPPVLENEEGIFHVYNSYILKILLQDTTTPLFVFAVPFSRMLGHAIDHRVSALNANHQQTEMLSFLYLDLTDFCRSYTSYRLPENIAVTRVVQKSEGLFLKRITLTGSDVLRSAEYIDLVSVSSPQSIKITKLPSDPSEKNPFSIGVDDYGNWNFHFKKFKELSYIYKIIAFLDEGNLLKGSFAVPHKREQRNDI